MGRKARGGASSGEAQGGVRHRGDGRVGGRAGRVMGVVGALPAEFPAAMLIVQHLDPKHRSMLADMLGRRARCASRRRRTARGLRSGVILPRRPTGTCW